MSTDGESRPAKRVQPLWRRALPWLARLLVVGLIAFWFVRYADLDALYRALASISPLAFVPALTLSISIIVIGGFRWRVMMTAFGARELPSLAVMVRLFFIGLFYNTYIPGAVGGDLVRGVVTRRYFEESAASYIVVLLERLIGMTGLGVVFGVGLYIGPRIFTTEELLPWLVVVVVLVLGILVFILVSGRLSHHLNQLPTLRRPALLLVVLAVSLVSHLCGISVVYSLARGMDLPVAYSGLVLVVPIALTAGFVPLAIGGVGAREVTLVAMFRLLGVETEQGVALSLAYAGVNLVVAGIGGLFQLFQGRIGEGESRE